MLNRIVIAGRLTADPEFKTTPAGVPVTTFRLASDRDFKDKQTGEKETDFVTVVAWRQTAEFVSRYFIKGRAAVVDGRLQIRQYTDKEGGRRSATEIVADHVYFGDSAPQADSAQPQQRVTRASRPPDVDAEGFKEIEDADGDLPF